MERAQWQVTTAGRRLSGAAPRLDLRSQRVDTLDQRVRSALRAQVVSLAERLARCETGLRHLDPSAVLDRGYAIVRDDAGRIVRDGATLKVEDRIAVEFATGDATARVESSRGG
jgi:exodeoxyribonuclease VII large subunit